MDFFKKKPTIGPIHKKNASRTIFSAEGDYSKHMRLQSTLQKEVQTSAFTAPLNGGYHALNDRSADDLNIPDNDAMRRFHDSTYRRNTTRPRIDSFGSYPTLHFDNSKDSTKFSSDEDIFNKKSIPLWRRVFFSYKFPSREMEKIFQMFAYPFAFYSLKCLLILLIILTISLALVNLVFVGGLSLENISNTSLCFSFALILVCIHTRFMNEKLLPIVVVLVVLLILIFCSISFAIDDRTLNTPPFEARNFRRQMLSDKTLFSRSEAVWRMSVCMIFMYCFLPLRFHLPAFLGVFLSISHFLLSLFLPVNGEELENLLPKQVTGNLVIFLMVNLACMYVYRWREREVRLVFHNIRKKNLLQVVTQDESTKMNKLLSYLVPASVAHLLKEDLPLRSQYQRVYALQHDDVSLVFGDVSGLNYLQTQCSSLEFVRFLNELFGRFDQLAQENGCTRIQIQGDRYFCVAGLGQERCKHARNAVEMGLDMIDFVNFLATLSSIPLKTRVAVHSGAVTAGVVGTERWCYDVCGKNTFIASMLEKFGKHGKVIVTSKTLDRLEGKFPVEINNDEFQLKLKSYFIVNHHPRKHYFLPKTTSYQPNRTLSSILASIKFNVEQPFTSLPQTPDLRPIFSGEALEGVLNNYKRCNRGLWERYHRHLVQTIKECSNHLTHTTHANLLTFKFKNAQLEKEHSEKADKTFVTELIISLTLLVFTLILHTLLLPRSLFLLLFFLLSFAWTCIVLMLLLAFKLKCIKWNLWSAVFFQKLITISTIFLHLCMALSNTFCCRGSLFFPLSTYPQRYQSSLTNIVSFYKPSYLVCYLPQYIYLNSLSCFLVCFIFTRLASIVKLAMWLSTTVAYVVVVEVTNKSFFVQHGPKFGNEAPGDSAAILMLLHLLIGLYLCSRNFEWISRTKTFWQSRLKSDRERLLQVSDCNDRLLKACLPPHVASSLPQTTINKGTYWQGHEVVVVVSLTAWQGKSYLEDIKSINQVISTLDKIQASGGYQSLLKLKSFGATYIITSGVKPSHKIHKSVESQRSHLVSLVDYVMEAMVAVRNTTQDGLKLTAGIDMGQGLSGVIGGTRPHFDLWAQCVNHACKLDASSLPGSIMTSGVVRACLEPLYEFQCNGEIQINKNQKQLTYFLIRPRSKNQEMHSNYKINNNLMNTMTLKDVTLSGNNRSFPSSKRKSSSHGNTLLESFTETSFRSSVDGESMEGNYRDSNGHSLNNKTPQPDVIITEHNTKNHPPPDQLITNLDSSYNNDKQTSIPLKEIGFKAINRLTESDFSTTEYESNSGSPLNCTNHKNYAQCRNPCTNILHSKVSVDDSSHKPYDNVSKTSSNTHHPPNFFEKQGDKKVSMSQHIKPTRQLSLISDSSYKREAQSFFITDDQPFRNPFNRNERHFSAFKPLSRINRSAYSVVDGSHKHMEFLKNSKREDFNVIINQTSFELFLENYSKQLQAQNTQASKTYAPQEKLEELSKFPSVKGTHGGEVLKANINLENKVFVNDNKEKVEPLQRSHASSENVSNFFESDSSLDFENGIIFTKEYRDKTKKSKTPCAVKDDILPTKSAKSVEKSSSQSGRGVSLGAKNNDDYTKLCSFLKSKLKKELDAESNDENKTFMNKKVTKTNSEEKLIKDGKSGSNMRQKSKLKVVLLQDKFNTTNAERGGTSSIDLKKKIFKKPQSRSLSSDAIAFFDVNINQNSPKLLHRATNKKNISRLTSELESRKFLKEKLSEIKKIPRGDKNTFLHHLENLSISSLNSEMSHSDPVLSCESESVIDSEYDNYRSGMASDEDYFVFEAVSDVELDTFDDFPSCEHPYENFNYNSLLKKK